MCGIGRPQVAPSPAARACGERWRLLARSQPVESFTLGLMATWEITITRRDGSRLRLSDRIDHAPLKGEIFDTADIGQTIKARIDAYRQERPGASRPPFYQVTATEI
jgi:hypothetical protein